MSERDPRVNPRPGDVLRKKFQGQYFESRGYIEREVFDVDEQTSRVTYAGDSCCLPQINLSSWRRWARDAKVVKCGDDNREI